jgi:hypothetical protein
MEVTHMTAAVIKLNPGQCAMVMDRIGHEGQVPNVFLIPQA